MVPHLLLLLLTEMIAYYLVVMVDLPATISDTYFMGLLSYLLSYHARRLCLHRLFHYAKESTTFDERQLDSLRISERRSERLARGQRELIPGADVYSYVSFSKMPDGI